jgi:2-polyprenyl-6-methoxyphenol hydroxylase-like FAD-dependent oxidoreductase
MPSRACSTWSSGADGLHSNVRRLVWGAERQFRRLAGWYFAGDVEMPNELGFDHQTLSFSEPGRTLTLSSGRDPRVVDVSFVFAADQLEYDRHDRQAMAWEVNDIQTTR